MVTFQRRAWQASYARERLAEVLDKAGGWSKQPRVPTGPKGGQWTAGGGMGGGAGWPGSGSQPLVAPQYGQGGTARMRFEADAGAAVFTAPLKQTELTGLPAYLDNPYGFVLKDPSSPTDVDGNANPDDVATFVAGVDPGPGLNGVPFKSWDGPPGGDWTKPGGQGDFDEPEWPKAGGKRLGAGVIVREPDGRVWTVSPLNQFGGYEETFPKGGIEEGLNLRQTAIKEAFEESGLRVRLTGYLGDFERTTSVARYYSAERIGGDPTDAHWESQAVNLVPLTELKERIIHHADAPILALLSGEPAKVQKALLALADLIDLAGPYVGNDLEKKGKGSWNKQLRVPSGLPTGGQWTNYGGGGIGGAYAAGGVALKLQVHGGTGPQAEALNKKIAEFEAAANQGYLHPAAAKLLAGAPPVQTYSSAAYQSAAEAAAYVGKGGMDPTLGGKLSDTPELKAENDAILTAHNAVAAKPTLASDLAILEGLKPKWKQPAGTAADPMKLSDMTKVAPKPGGSAQGGIFEAPDGTRWLVKSYKDQKMASNEVIASKLYNMLGVETPHMKLIDTGSDYHGGMAVASKMLDGVKPLDPSNPAHVKAVQQQFGAHALLANWDAIGLSFDNTVIGPQGQAIMVDPGGSLLYRAMGGLKGDAFGNTVGEVDTLRNPFLNPTSAKVFGPMTESALAASMVDAGIGYQYGMGHSLNKLIDDHAITGFDATHVKNTMALRAKDILAKASELEAQNASTSTLDIATTGTTTGILEHGNPDVNSLLNKPNLMLDDLINHGTNQLAKLQDELTPGSADFYSPMLSKLSGHIKTGDVDALLSSYEFNYIPSSTAGKTSANYGKFLKAKEAAIAATQAQAAKATKAQGKPGAGTMVTGAAKVTAPEIAAAKAVEHLPKTESVQNLAVAEHLTPSVPKPAAELVTKIPPAMPDKPIVVTPANPPGKLSKQVDLIEQYAKQGGPDAAAKIQAISGQINGTNGYAKKAKQYAADAAAALGGQPHIDAMPHAAKVEAFDTALQVGAKTIKQYGTIKVEERESIVKFDPDSVPEPPSFANWKGPGKPLYNSEPHLNAINDAKVQAMFSAAKANDLAKLQGMDPGPSKHVTQYKANLGQLLSTVGNVVKKTKLISGESGGKVNGAQVAKDLGNAFKAKPSWSADADKFYKFVIAGSTDKGMAQAVHKSIPQHKLTTSSQATGALLNASHANIGGNSKLKASFTSYTGGGYSGMNAELRDGVKGTSSFENALQHAKNVEKVINPLPEGLVLSRKINLGSFSEWEKQVGKIISEPGITSTSIDPKQWSGNIGFKMTVGAGVDGAYVGNASKSAHSTLSSNPSESEVVLPRNTKWYIAGVRKFSDGDDFFNESIPGHNRPSVIVDVVILPHDKIAEEA